MLHWLSSRASGILLHPTSLPGGQTVGTLGAGAFRFLDFMEEAEIKYWQVCPIGPTGYGDSPYQCFSAFAGNPYLIDLKQLVSNELLTDADIAPLETGDTGAVDFGALYRLKWPILRKAYQRFTQRGTDSAEFEVFRGAQAAWLESYGWFRALKDYHGGKPWWDWPESTRTFSGLPAVLRSQLEPEAIAHQYYQFLFFRQWNRIRAEAGRRGISLIGDIPIFAAADSADVWADPALFELGPDGRPIAVAGVPPDYFSEDGQLWGNPLYRWKIHQKDGYAWWMARLKASFEACDVLRIDHFRGFDAYWRIPLPADNARIGEWRQGPGIDFFRKVAQSFPGARIIAEDLGLLTDSVVELRKETGLPGMAILQFAFGGEATNTYLPHNLVANCVLYPGTHDNDTTLGWYRLADEKTRDHVRRYLRVDGREVSWDFIRAASGSVSNLAVYSAQDIMSLGSDCRLNTPGKAHGNWRWRMKSKQLEQLMSNGTAGYLREMARLHGRA